MANFIENNEQRRRAFRRYYNERTNKRLKYIALASVSVAIFLMIIMVFSLDSLSMRSLLFMRGCAGLFAIVFIVLAATIVYRANVAYFKDKAKIRHKISDPPTQRNQWEYYAELEVCRMGLRVYGKMLLPDEKLSGNTLPTSSSLILL